MVDTALVTSSDSKGVHIMGLFEVAIDKAQLTPAEAQLVVEQGGELQTLAIALLKDVGAGRLSAESKRIQFVFPNELAARMDSMKQQIGAKNYAEVIRKTLQLFEWFLEQTKAGNDIGLIKDDTLIKTVKFMF